VSPPATLSPPPPARPQPKRARKRAQAKKEAARDHTRKQVVRRSVSRPVADDANAPDGLLLAGGLALFVLVLADTVFLTVSRRSLRPS